MLRPGSAWPRTLLDLGRVRRYLTWRMKTTVSSKGQIVLPAELRQQDQIEAGQEFEVERVDRGEYRLVRRPRHPNEGVVDWLLACPEKDFFVPIESESTDRSAPSYGATAFARIKSEGLAEPKL